MIREIQERHALEVQAGRLAPLMKSLAALGSVGALPPADNPQPPYARRPVKSPETLRLNFPVD